MHTARDKQRRKRRGGPLLVPGFCLPKALSPVLPIYLQGVLQASVVVEVVARVCMGWVVWWRWGVCDVSPPPSQAKHCHPGCCPPPAELCRRLPAAHC